VDYDGSDHTLIRDDDILLMYSGTEMKLSEVQLIWDRILVKIEKSNESTASGIVVAPTASGTGKASEGEVNCSVSYPNMTESNHLIRILGGVRR